VFLLSIISFDETQQEVCVSIMGRNEGQSPLDAGCSICVSNIYPLFLYYSS
jgi:hypothetical protein